MEQAAAQLTLLARVGAILGSGLPRQETLERVADLLVPEFAGWCAIDLETEDGMLERRVALPKAFPPLPPDAPHGPAIVMRTGEPEFVREINEDALFSAARGNWAQLAVMRELRLKSAMCIPLSTGPRVIGTLSLLATSRPYANADLELMSEVARRTATAIESDRTRERTQMLFEASPTAMWVYDFETLNFLAVNDATVERYGYSREELLGMTIKDIRPPEEIPALLADLASHRGAGSRQPKEWRHRCRDGSMVDVEVTTGRIDYGGRNAVLVVAHDVSERKRLERRLTDAEKMEAIGRLAGGVAHDFNNLLTVISGYAEILRARDGGGDEIEEIARAARQAAGLTRQLLAFSRRQVLHPKVLDLNEIVAGMEQMLHRIIGDDVSVGTRLAPDLAPVEADRAQLERVILNLAANARDAMPGGGTLTIETRNLELSQHGEDGLDGPFVLLMVSDTGVGMDDEVRAHLFEPFFTTKPGGEGTGLGLSTVFGVVKQSGGAIYAYSERGSGTTFKIYLPAAPCPEGRPPEAAAEPEPTSGTETVLVVEDDPNVRDLVRLLLEHSGYTVLTAQDAGEAVRACTELGVDLLLTDVMMPEVSGQALAERVAQAAPDVRILFMSGYSDDAVQRQGLLAERAAFIEKPFTERALTTKVREVLDGG